MKKKLLKFFIIIGALALLLTQISTTQVQAVLQSNPNTHYKKNNCSAVAWMGNFRNMEVNGGALGLKETIDSKTKLGTSESNNLDTHMMKSTEFGAIAILSVSGYGNSTTLQKSTIKSTTGNETGLYWNGGKHEFVAGGRVGKIFSGVNERYYDSYTDSISSARIGDAMGQSTTPNPGCYGWHSAGTSYWGYNEYYIRGGYGLFYFSTYDTRDGYFSRGVVVCGEGL